MGAVPNNFKEAVMEGSIDLTADTVKVALISDDTAYTFDPAAHSFVNDILDGGTTATEFTGSGYSRQTLQGVVIYQQIGGDDTTPGDDRVLAVVDDDSAGSNSDLPLTTNGSDVTLSFNAEGVINIT